MKTEFKTAAVWNKDHYYHFGIHPVTCKMYGHELSDIVDINFTIDEDQTLPESNTGSMTADYWGWFDEEKQEFTMIYPQRFLLGMCFAYGIKSSEDSNQGKAYRIKLIE